MLLAEVERASFAKAVGECAEQEKQMKMSVSSSAFLLDKAFALDKAAVVVVAEQKAVYRADHKD